MSKCSMYVRIKREKQTIFMYCEPTDTVFHLKEKVSPLVKKSPEDIALYHKKAQVTDDKKTIGDCSIQNDDVLQMTFCENGTWETLN